MGCYATASRTSTLQGKAEMDALGDIVEVRLGNIRSRMKISVQTQGGIAILWPKPTSTAAVPATPPVALHEQSPFGESFSHSRLRGESTLANWCIVQFTDAQSLRPCSQRAMHVVKRFVCSSPGKITPWNTSRACCRRRPQPERPHPFGRQQGACGCSGGGG